VFWNLHGRLKCVGSATRARLVPSTLLAHLDVRVGCTGGAAYALQDAVHPGADVQRFELALLSVDRGPGRSLLSPPAKRAAPWRNPRRSPVLLRELFLNSKLLDGYLVDSTAFTAASPASNNC